MKLTVATFVVLLCAILLPSQSRAQIPDDLEPACAPNTPESKNWPVKAVYLHSIFSVGQKSGEKSRATEIKNRKELIELANRLKIRIAMPVANTIGKNRLRQWNLMSMEEMEMKASQACGDSPLAPDRLMIGNINGAQKIRQIGLNNCEMLASYSKLLAFNAPPPDLRTNCPPGKYERHQTASFPSAMDLEYLLRGSVSSGEERPQQMVEAVGGID